MANCSLERSDLDVIAPDQLELEMTCLFFSTESLEIPPPVGSTKVTCFYSMESLGVLSFGMINQDHFPLLNGVLRRSVFWCRQAPQFTSVVGISLVSNAYSRVKNVHFGNDNYNVMFMLFLKSKHVHWNYDI